MFWHYGHICFYKTTSLQPRSLALDRAMACFKNGDDSALLREPACNLATHDKLNSATGLGTWPRHCS